LEIEEWEIWHTYSTYLESTTIDLLDTGRRLVASGIAECAMLRDGRTFWRSNGMVSTGSTAVQENSSRTPFTFRLDRDEGCAEGPSGFALEAWAQCAYFLIGERRMLGKDTALPSPYLRAYLGKCIVTYASSEDGGSRLSLYPVLLVYASGVVIVEFRMIGPDIMTKLDDFITTGVNLFTRPFESVEVNPGLAAFATRAYYQSNRRWSVINRFQLMRLQAGHDLAVRQKTRKDSDEDFSFDLAPLSGSESDYLKSIAMTIIRTTAFIAAGPRMGLGFILWGQISSLEVGEFWSGRPHIHLVRFRGQCGTASENEVRHGSDFVRILARVSALDEITARRALPKDARLFQDYSAYITSASSLWVWSLDGLSAQEPWMDRNRGNLIYERQVLAELLEYGYMLHRSLYHRVDRFDTTAKVVAVRREILRLRRNMREASHSGEIRELLDNGWKALGLSDLVSDIDDGLRLRESETRTSDAMRTARIGWVLTVIFGLVAVPALADQVIQPIWKLTPLPQFSDSSLNSIVSDGIAVLIVILFLWVTLLVFSSAERE
jgi:hypothetical protein